MTFLSRSAKENKRRNATKIKLGKLRADHKMGKSRPDLNKVDLLHERAEWQSGKGKIREIRTFHLT